MQLECDISLLNEMFQKSFVDYKDEFAVSMFSSLIRNNPTLIPRAIHLILEKVKCSQIPESLRALEILEVCMNKSGPEFQADVSKYRFLNELSKLVSKKYNGHTTPNEIKLKIMDSFLLWTAQFPEKEKIKAVYDCLKKEGIDSTRNSNSIVSQSFQRKNDFVDEANEKKLKSLLQSTNKDDIKKANLLIQYLVKQNEKKVERVLKQKLELKEICNTIHLFNEVIDSFFKEKSENSDSTLLDELFFTCSKHKNLVSKMPDVMEDSEEKFIVEIIRVSDDLFNVIQKYENLKRKIETESEKNGNNENIEKNSNNQIDELLSITFDEPNGSDIKLDFKCRSLEQLNDIFASSIPSNCLSPEPVKKLTPSKEQYTLQKDTKKARNNLFMPKIDELFQETLKHFSKNKSFFKEAPNVSSNEFIKSNQQFDLNKKDKTAKNIFLSDVNIDEENIHSNNGNEIMKHTQEQINFNILSEIEIDLEDIVPGDQESLVLLNSKYGLKVVLNFTKNKPLANIFVFVISSFNQSQISINNFQIDAFISKPSKLLLLQSSGTFLPGVKPFRPPSDLQQIMLVYNPSKEPIDITYTFQYNYGPDTDPINESFCSYIPYLA